MPNTCCLMGVWMRSLSRSGLALRGDQPLGGITCSKLGESEQKQLLWPAVGGGWRAAGSGARTCGAATISGIEYGVQQAAFLPASLFT